MERIILFFTTLIVLSFGTLNAQVQWYPITGPTIGTTGPLTIPINYGIDQVGTVYIAIQNYTDPTLYSSATIKTVAIAGPAGTRIYTAVLPVNAGNINTVLQVIADVFAANTTHTVYLAGESPAGSNTFVSATAVRLLATTKSCPDINLFTYFGNTGDCVNLGATAQFQAAQIGAIPTGVLKGTTWTVDWGDGTPVYSYTSTAENDIPPAQNHTFTNLTTCNYVGTWTVQNPCGKFSNGSTVFVVHGRDIPVDGDGILRVVEDISSTPDIYYVCEGKTYYITLRDNSTWNCQNPVVPAPLVAKPNIDPRTIQWIYGEHPVSGAVGSNNTITGNVLIDGIHIANSANGYIQAPIGGLTSVGQTSLEITIPNTSVVGQRFYVYLKNWNKCNPFVDESLDYIYEDFIIEVIDAPDAPIVTSPQDYCFDTYPSSVSAVPNTLGNSINWYDDAVKTTLLGTGLSYNHGETTPGVYDFYAAETSGVNSCEGPTAHIQFTIREELTRPGVITGPTAMCTGAAGLVFSVAADPPLMPFGGTTEYLWTVPAGWTITAGQGTKQITATAGLTTGTQTVSVLTRYTTAPTCQSPSRDLSVTVSPQPTAPTLTKSPNVATLCVGPTLTVTIVAGTGGAGTVTDEYRYSTNNGSTWSAWSTTIPSFASVIGTNLVESRRTATGPGCTTSASNQVSWTVVADPVAPVITKNPADATVCAGATLTITVTTPGSGGTGTNTDQYRYSTNNGGTWTAWGTTIPSFAAVTGTNLVESRRNSTGTGCASNVNQVSWTVVADPVAPVIAKSPADGTICVGPTLTITVTTPGSGGTGTNTDEYRYSTNNGGSWSAWSTTIPSFASVVGTNLVQSRRNSTGTGCNSNVNQVSWTVVADPVAPVIAKSPNDAIVCAGATLTITITTPGSGGTGTNTDQYRYSTDNGGTWSAWGTTIPSFVAVIGTNLVESRRNSTGTGCISNVNQVSWDAIPDPVAPVIVKNPADAIVCAGAMLTITVSTPGSGGTGTNTDQYRYSTNNGGSWSAWSTTIPSFVAVTGTNLVESRRNSTGAGCVSNVNQVSWTVVADPIAPVIAKNPNVASVCSGTTLTISITTPGSGGTGTNTDEYRYSTNNGGSWSAWSSTIPSFAAVIGTNLIESRRNSTGTGCNSNVNQVSWTVVAQPVAPGLTKDPNQAAVCEGVTLTVTTTPGSGGTGTVADEYRYSTDNGTTWNAWGTTVPSFAAVPGTNRIESRRTATGTGCNTSPSNSVSWTVDANPTPVISGVNNVCANDAGVIYSTPSAGGRTYVWAISGGLITAGAGTNEITVTWGAAGAGWVRVTETIVVSGCAITTPNYNVTINPGAPATAPVFGTGATEICREGTLDINVSDVATAAEYVWDYSWVGVAGSEDASTLLSEASISLAGLIPGTYTVSVAAKNGCGRGPWMPVHTFDINDIPDLSALSANPCSDVATGINLGITNLDATYCSGITYNITTINFNGLTASAGAPVTGPGFAANVIADDAYTNTTGADVNVVYTVEPVSAQGCTGAAEDITITVKSKPVGANASLTTCEGVALSYNLQALNINVLGNSQLSTFSWVAADNPNITGESTSPQSTGTITDNLINTSNVFQTVVYTVTPTGINLCTGSNFTITVTVEPTPVISSPDKTICDNTGTGITVSTSTTTSNTTYYKWMVSGVGANISGASDGPVNGTVLGTPINQTLDNTGLTAQTVTYNITPWTGTAPGTLLCSGTPITVVVTVEPTPVISSPAAKTICDNTGTGITVSTSTTTSNTTYYTWTVSGVGPNITGAGNGPAEGTGLGTPINQTLDNTGTTAQTVTYIITPRTGTAPGSLLCSGAPINVVVTVEPTPVISSPAAKTICDNTGTGITVSTSTTTSNTTYYTWTVSGVGPNITGAGNGPAEGTGLGTPINQTLDNTGTTAQTVTYIITPRTGTAPGSLLCSGAPINVVVTVEPTPNVTTASSLIICSETATNIVLESNVTGTTYTWTIGTITGGITGATAGSGGTIAQTLTNPGASAGTVTYIVTPTINFCSGSPTNFVVTVNPKPVLSSTLTPADVCSNNVFSYTPTSATATTTFAWTRADVAGITPAGPTSGTNNPNETLRNITSAPIAVTYEYTLTANGCSNIQNVVVNIKPEPVITAGQNPTACSGNALNYAILMDNFVNPGANVEFTWAAPVLAPADPGFTGGTARLTQSAANITDTYTNTTGLIGSATYTVTPFYNVCAGDPVTVVVSVGSEPVLDPGLNRTVCSAEASGLILSEAPGSVVPTYYNITLQAIDAGLTPNYGANTLPNATAPADYLATHIFTNTTSVNQTVTYRVTPILAPDCIGNPVDVVVTVRPPILAGSITGNTAICYNTDAPEIPNAILASGGDGVISYEWYFTGNLAATPGDLNWTLIAGATSTSYDPGVLVNPTKYVRRANDGSCTAVAYSNMIQIDINPLPVTGVISGDATICESATNKVYQVPNTAGSTYQWTFPASLTMTSPQGYYFAIADAAGPSLPGDKITVVETFTSTTGCVGLPVEMFITVVATIPGEVVAGPASVCQGDANVAYSVTDNPGSTYSWVVPAGASISGDPTLHEILVTFNMAGSGDVSVVETNGTVCTTIHFAKAVTINPLPAVYNVTAPVAYCDGDPGVTITLSNSETGVNYQLYKDMAVEGAPVAGSTGSALTWINNLAGSYTVVATNATTTCTRAMNGTAVVTINIIVPGSVGTDHAICEGAAANPLTNIASATGGGSITYQWQSSIDNFATAMVNIVGATSAVYAPGVLTQDTWFRRVAYSTMGTSICSDESNTVLVTVINFVPGSVSADQTICEGETPATAFTSVPPSGDGVFSYQWKSSADGISYTDIGGATLETYAPGALTADTWFKRAVTATLMGVPCTEETNVVRVTVINFTPGSIATDQTICSGTAPAAFTSVAPSGDGVKTYQWQSSPDGLDPWTDIGGANAATYTSPALTTDTYFRRKVTSTLNAEQCDQYTNSVLVTINDFDPETISAAQTICEGEAPSAFTSVAPTGVGGTVFTFQWQSSIDNVTYSNIPGATSETYVSGALTLDTYFRRRVTSTLNRNACTEFTPEILVTVNNFTPGTITGTQTICEGDIPSAFTETAPAGDGVFTFQWEESSDNTTWNTIAGATAATYGPAALIQDMWYRRQVTSTLNGVPCTEVTNTIRVTVNNFDPGSIGSDHTICEGSTASPITSVSPTGDGTFTYKWYSSINDGGTWNLIAGTGETYNPGTLTQDTWYKREVTSMLNGKACTEETNEVRILVNNMTPGSITADQIICDGAIPAAFGSVAATGDGTITYQWENSTDGINFTVIAGATLETYTSVALIQDTWFRRAATSTTASPVTCTEYSNTVKVTVVNFTPGSVGSNQTICDGATPAMFTSVAASGDGTFAYLWEYSTVSDAGPWTTIPAATSATYAPGALTQDTWYRRSATSNLNASCVQYSNVVTVTVINFIPGSVSSTSTEICEGYTPAAFTSVAPTGDGAFTYQWQFSTNGTDYINIAAATSDVYAPGALTVDTWYRRQVVSTLNGTQCTQYTAAVKFTVNNFDPGSLTGNQTICEGDTPAVFGFVAPSGDGTTYDYQWEESSDGITWVDIALETNATYAPGAVTADTWYRREVTSNLGVSACTEWTNSVRVTVNNFDPGSISADQTICDGTAAAPFASVSPTGDGTFTYQWQSSLDGVSFSNIPGAQSETYNAGILTQDTWYKRIVTSTLNGKACTEETNVVKVTVINFVPGSISADVTICEGEDPAAFGSVTPTGDGVFTYQWQSSLDGFVFADISGAVSETYDPGVLTQDTWYKRIVKATLLGTDCFKETNVVRVTVINFVPGSIGSDQTICEATAPSTFTSVNPSGDGAFTFQWQDSPDGITFTDIAGANASSYTSPALSADRWFKRLVTSTLNGTPCTEETNAVKVTINFLAPGISTADQTICEGEIPATFNSTAPTGSGVLTYQWQSSLDGTNFSNITGANADSYTAGALMQDTWYRLSVVSTLNSNTCTEMTNIVLATVVNFTPGAISADQTVCEGGTPLQINGTLPAGDGVFTYQWQDSPDGSAFTNIGGATLQNYTPPALTQDTWYKRVVTSTLNTVPCVKETNVVRVTVNNFIPGSIAADETICEGSFPIPFTSVTPSGDGVFTYQWQRSTDNLTFTDIGGAVFETYNSPALTQDTWFKRKVTSTIGLNSCTDETNVIEVTVNNLVAGSIAGAQTICENEIPSAFTSVAPVSDGIVSYQWRSSIDGVNYVDITGATSETYTSTALNVDTWFKRVVRSTLSGVTCTKETNDIKVTVNNVQGGTIISDQTICNGGDPVSFMTIVNGSGDGAVTFQWQVSTDGTTFTDIPGATSPNYDAGVLTADTWYKRITKSLLSGVECTKESNVVKITINEVTGGTIAADQTICYGATPAPITSVDDGTASGSVTYQWQRSDNNVTWINIPGATTFGYAPGALLADTYYKRVISSILNGIVCTSESNVVKITINPLPVAMLTGGETICPAESSNLVVTMSVGTGPYTIDIQNYPGLTITGYVSGTNIPVSPAVTSTYTLLRVRDANGCEVLSPSANLTGSATVVVSDLPAITSFTPSPAVCEFTPATFRVEATGTNITYQWRVDEGSGFNNVVDGGNYSGATSPTLQIFTSLREMNGYVYQVVVSGCSTDVTSANATFTVNTAPEITLHPSDTTICLGEGAIMEADADGTSVTWQWQVNKGSGFVNVTDDANFSGSTTKTLTITNALATFNNWIFRARVSGICGVPVNSSFGRLKVTNPPVATLQPLAKEICEAASTSLIANGTGYITMQWQVSTDNGASWTNVADDANYGGSVTNQLAIVDAPVTFNNNRYRLALIGECATVNTNAVLLTVNPNPIVLFATDLNNCGGTDLILNGNPTGGTTPYATHRWTGDVGPLNNYTIQSPTFNSQITGTYMLTYTVKDAKGCSATDDIAVTVDSPDATFTQDVENGCTPLTVSFTKDMTGLSKFWWDFGDGSPLDSLNASPAHKFKNSNPASIEYRTVKLKVMSTGGCYDTFTSTVTVYPAVNATFTASDTIVCSGNSLTFTTSPGASKYYWEYGDGISGYSPTETTTHLYTNFTTAPQFLTVKLTTTSFYNCTDKMEMTIKVMPVPQAQFLANPPSQVYSPSGNPVSFTNQTNEGSWTYLWRFGDGATSADRDPAHTYTALGTYDVVLIVNNANCSDSITHKVYVLPPAPVADFDSIPSGCEPWTMKINNTSLNTDVPGTTYRWDFGDGSISTAKNPVYTYFDAGIFRVELTVTGPGGTSTKSQVVNAYPSPRAYFEVSPTFVFVNDEKVRAFNLSQGADSYLWEFGDGDTSKVKEPFHKYMEAGVYDITLWAYSNNGCTDKYVLSPGVTVEPAGEVRFSTVFTPNLDGPIERSSLPTGGTEIDQFFFPPIREKVIDYKLQVFNRLGVLIFESRDINIPWNGYYRGQLCSQGVYVWYVEGKYANGQPFKKVGDVTLLH